MIKTNRNSYFVLLCVSMVRDAGGVMSATCCTPTLRVCFFVSFVGGKKNMAVIRVCKPPETQMSLCKHTHLYWPPAVSHAAVAAMWPGTRCSCAESPSSSAGGKHCSYDCGSSFKKKNAHIHKERVKERLKGERVFISWCVTYFLTVASDGAEVAVELVGPFCSIALRFPFAWWLTIVHHGSVARLNSCTQCRVVFL